MTSKRQRYPIYFNIIQRKAANSYNLEPVVQTRLEKLFKLLYCLSKQLQIIFLVTGLLLYYNHQFYYHLFVLFIIIIIQLADWYASTPTQCVC